MKAEFPTRVSKIRVMVLSTGTSSWTATNNDLQSPPNLSSESKTQRATTKAPITPSNPSTSIRRLPPKFLPTTPAESWSPPFPPSVWASVTAGAKLFASVSNRKHCFSSGNVRFINRCAASNCIPPPMPIDPSAINPSSKLTLGSMRVRLLSFCATVLFGAGRGPQAPSTSGTWTMDASSLGSPKMTPAPALAPRALWPTEMPSRRRGKKPALMVISGSGREEGAWKGSAVMDVLLKPVSVELPSSAIFILMRELLGIARSKPYVKLNVVDTWKPTETTGRNIGPTVAMPGMVKPGRPISGRGNSNVVRPEGEVRVIALSNSMWAATSSALSSKKPSSVKNSKVIFSSSAASWVLAILKKPWNTPIVPRTVQFLHATVTSPGLQLVSAAILALLYGSGSLHVWYHSKININ